MDATHKTDVWILSITAIVLLAIIIVAGIMFFRKDGVYKPYDWNTTKMSCPDGSKTCYKRLAGDSRPLTAQEICRKNAWAAGADPNRC